MKILFTADWHVHPRNYENTLPAIEAFVEYTLETKPDLVIHGGDLFDTRGRLDPTSIDHVRRAFERILRHTPAVVVPGNHDAANAWGEVDSASAVLNGLGAPIFPHVPEGLAVGVSVPISNNMLTVESQPCIRGWGKPWKELFLAALPCPSKYHLKAAPSAGGEEPSVEKMMVDILRGLAAEAAKLPPAPKVLVFHGSVAGASMDNEQLVGVGQEVVLPVDAINGPWDIVLAGHLHKAQEVHGVHYAGSLTQLTFAQAGYKPSFMEITLRDQGPDKSPKTNGGGAHVEVKRVSVPVHSPHTSIAVNTTDERFDPGMNLTDNVKQALVSADMPENARVRAKIKATADQLVHWDENRVREAFPGVKSWKTVIERVAPVRIRSDVTTETSPTECLKEWVKLNPSLGPIADEIHAVAEEVIKQIPLEARTPELADYRPIETTFDNFKQFSTGAIHWAELPSITVIKGPNGGGKTNAARSEPTALFGPKILGSPIRRFVRNGETAGNVIHTFEAGGKRYKIQRTVKLSGSGKPAGDVSFAVKGVPIEAEAPDANVWMSLNGADARETQARIEKIVGSPEMFFATRFLRQGRIDQLLRVTPSEFKAVLQEALQAKFFAVIERKARDRALESKTELEGLRLDYQVAADRSKGKDEIEKLMVSSRGYAKTVEADIRRLDGDLGIARANRVVALTDLRTLDAKQEREKSIQGQIFAKELQLKTRRRELEGLENLLAEAEELDSQIEALGELKGLVRDHEAKRLRYAEAEGEIKRLEERIAGAARAHRRQIETTEGELEVKRRQAALLEAVPCQDGDLFNSYEDISAPVWGDAMAKETRGCQFLLDAVKASQDVPLLEAGVATLEKDRSHLEGPTEKLQASLKEQTALQYDNEQHRRHKGELDLIDEGELNRKAQAMGVARGKIQAIENEITAIKAELLAREQELLDVVTTEDADEIRQRMTEATRAIDSSEQQVKDRRADASRVATRLGALDEQHSAAVEAAANVTVLNASIKQTSRRLQALEALVGAVSRDGIPFLILERAIPQLQDVMNQLLDGSPLSVLIEPVRDLESGKARDDVVIKFTDQNGEQVLQDASGYQANILGLALAAGVASLEGDRAGVRPEFFIIDEGFGAYDPDNIPHGREMIHRLAKRFGKVVFITHVPEVQDAAEGQIIVTPSPDGSTLEEVSR